MSNNSTSSDSAKALISISDTTRALIYLGGLFGGTIIASKAIDLASNHPYLATTVGLSYFLKGNKVFESVMVIVGNGISSLPTFLPSAVTLGYIGDMVIRFAVGTFQLAKSAFSSFLSIANLLYHQGGIFIYRIVSCLGGDVVSVLSRRLFLLHAERVTRKYLNRYFRITNPINFLPFEIYGPPPVNELAQIQQTIQERFEQFTADALSDRVSVRALSEAIAHIGDRISEIGTSQAPTFTDPWNIPEPGSSNFRPPVRPDPPAHQSGTSFAPDDSSQIDETEISETDTVIHDINYKDYDNPKILKEYKRDIDGRVHYIRQYNVDDVIEGVEVQNDINSEKIEDFRSAVYSEFNRIDWKVTSLLKQYKSVLSQYIKGQRPNAVLEDQLSRLRWLYNENHESLERIGTLLEKVSSVDVEPREEYNFRKIPTFKTPGVGTQTDNPAPRPRPRPKTDRPFNTPSPEGSSDDSSDEDYISDVIP